MVLVRLPLKRISSLLSFHIMVKTNGPICNLGCTYCYYLEKEELYPEGEAPDTEWERTPADDPRWGSVLPQDFSNMAAVQQGMKSCGFSGPKPNPYMERAVSSLHRNLASYMGAGAPRKLE